MVTIDTGKALPKSIELPIIESRLHSYMDLSEVALSPAQLTLVKSIVNKRVDSPYYCQATGRYSNLHEAWRILRAAQIIGTIDDESRYTVKSIYRLLTRIQGLHYFTIMALANYSSWEIDRYSGTVVGDDLEDEFGVETETDLDPSQVAELSKNRLIGWSYSALSKNEAHLPPLDFLENANATITIQPTSESQINLKLTERLEDYQLSLLKSPVGTGKTELLMEFIISQIVLGKRILFIVPYRSLAYEAYAKFSAAFQANRTLKKLKIEPSIYLGDNGIAKNASEIEKLSMTAFFLICSVDSLAKLSTTSYGLPNSFDAVVIDEADSGLNRMLRCPQVKNRQQVIQKHAFFVNKATHTILLDADLSQATLDYYQGILPKDAKTLLHINRNAHHKAFLSYPNLDTIEAKLFATLDANNKAAIATDSRAKAENLETRIKERYPNKRVLAIYSEQTEDSERAIAAFMSNVNSKAKEYDVIIYNQRMLSGVSITCPDFPNLFLFAGSHKSDAPRLHQLIGRFRLSKTIHYHIGTGVDFDSLASECPAMNLLGQLTSFSQNQLSSSELDLKTGLPYIPLGLIPAYRAYAQLGSDEATSLRALSSHFESLINLEIHTLSKVDKIKDDQLKRERASANKANKDAALNRIITAPQLSESQTLEQLKAVEQKTKEQQSQYKRLIIQERLKIDLDHAYSPEFSNVLTIFYSNKSKLTNAYNLILSLTPRELIARRLSKNADSFVADLKRDLLLHKIAHESGLIDYLQSYFTHNLTSLTKKHPELTLGQISESIQSWLNKSKTTPQPLTYDQFEANFITHALNNLDLLEKQFNLKSNYINPIELRDCAEKLKGELRTLYVNKFLASFGLKTESKTTKTKDRKSIRTRQLEPVSTTLITAWSILSVKDFAFSQAEKHYLLIDQLSDTREFALNLEEFKTYSVIAGFDPRKADSPLSLKDLILNTERCSAHLIEPSRFEIIIDTFPLFSRAEYVTNKESFKWWGKIDSPLISQHRANLRSTTNS